MGQRGLRAAEKSSCGHPRVTVLRRIACDVAAAAAAAAAFAFVFAFAAFAAAAAAALLSGLAGLWVLGSGLFVMCMLASCRFFAFEKLSNAGAGISSGLLSSGSRVPAT